MWVIQTQKILIKMYVMHEYSVLCGISHSQYNGCVNLILHLIHVSIYLACSIKIITKGDEKNVFSPEIIWKLFHGV